MPKIVPFSDKDDEDREMNKSSKFFERPLVVDQSFFEVEAIPEAEPLSPALKVINIQKEISSGPLEPPADKSLPILTKLKASKAENIEEWLDDLI